MNFAQSRWSTAVWLFMAAIPMLLFAAGAAAQRQPPFGQEKVETREFRNKEVEKALSRYGSAHNHDHNHGHGAKGHKGHKH